MKFWLGTHRPTWLRREDVAVPLFVSHVTLREYKKLPRAVAPWVLDSGAFSEIGARGADAFSKGPGPYVAAVRRYRDEIGRMVWAAPQDWMCEPFMVTRTGLTLVEHQRRTVRNLLALRDLAPDLPFVPVLQGWEPDDYLRHVDDYLAAGIDLASELLVGVGSICRRNRAVEVVALMQKLAAGGLSLHAFGAKSEGAIALAPYVTSCDSTAWSYRARRSDPLPGCVGHKNCANCHRYALAWRARLLSRSAHLN